jgi:1-hydroxy-2-naphthoate dioxygenase
VNRAEQVAATRARLLRAGERLFAELGIHQVRLREINALAGQRNSSALHYHFGSREGLVEAILSEHQTAMDHDVRPALDALVASPDEPTVRAAVAIWVDALDVPFLLGLNQPFYEPYPGNKVQTLREKAGEHLQQRAGAVRPTWENTRKENLPLRYAWKDIEPQLRALADQPGTFGQFIVVGDDAAAHIGAQVFSLSKEKPPAVEMLPARRPL